MVRKKINPFMDSLSPKSDKKKTMCNFDEFQRDTKGVGSQIERPKMQLEFFFQDTDIHVGSDHPVHRSSPFTQQSRGCSLQGDYISFPYHFFTNWNVSQEIFGDPAKVFAHEWSKYRYGIFDEFGYENDKLFPHFYKVNGNIIPTGSSDTQIKGKTFQNIDFYSTFPLILAGKLKKSNF